MSSDRIKILFVAGMGRSGSTILDTILGQVQGVFSGGELAYLYDRGVGKNLLCGCQSSFRDCVLWSRVMARLPGLTEETVAELISVRQQLTPRRAVSLSEIFAYRSPPGLCLYQEHLSCLYRAIAEESGDRVIVDSSKFPGHGLAISRLPGVEFHVLHLVRDPRALAHAWQQKRIYDSSGEETVWFSLFTPSVCSRLWMRWNLAIEAMWQDHPRYRFVRYEDFIAEPVATVAEILGGLGLESTQLPFVSDHEVELEPTHAMAGNPSRFSLGVVPLRLDVAWEETQSASERRLVTALTWPLLQRYGYLSG